MESQKNIEITSDPGSSSNVKEPRQRLMSEKGQQFAVETKLKAIKKCHYKLKCESVKILDLIQLKRSFEDAHSDWITEYIEFVNLHDQLVNMCQSVEFEECQQQLAELYSSLTTIRQSLQQAVDAQQTDTINPDDSISNAGSRKSVTESLVAARLEEERAKAEATALASILKKRQELEKKEFELKQSLETFEIETKLTLANARAEAVKKVIQEESGYSFTKQDTPKAEGKSVSNFNPYAPSYTPIQNQSKSETDMHDRNIPPVLNEDCLLVDPIIHPSEPTNTLNVIQSVVKHLSKPAPDIKKFSGDPLEYKRFIRQFETKICLNSDSEDEKLNYLDQFTEGEAHKLVSGFGYLDASIGYQAARAELEERYGNDQILANAFVNRVLSWPNIRADNTKALDEFSILLSECLCALTSIPAVKTLEYPDNMRKIVAKLPYGFQEKWRNIVYSTQNRHQAVQFHQLVSFVKCEAKKASDPVYGKDFLKPDQVYSKEVKRPVVSLKHKSTFATNNYSNPSNEPKAKEVKSTGKYAAVNNPCLFCTGEHHSLERCFKLLAQPIQDRLDFLKSKGLCFGCLLSGHMRRDCKNKLTCSKCDGNHPTCCHTDYNEPREKAADITSAYSCLPSVHTGAGIDTCTMAIIPVQVKLKNSLRCVTTYAFLDPGSSISFCTESLMSSLGGSGKKMKITLDTMGPRQTVTTQAIRGLEIYDLQMQNCIKIPTAYTKGRIPVRRSQIPRSADIKHWPHLADIELPQIEGEVGLLIGNDIPDVYTPLEIRTGEPGSPYASKTRLGWVIWGLTRKSIIGKYDKVSTNFSVNRTEIIAIEECNELKALDKLVRESMNLDFPERIKDDRKEWSKEEEVFMEKVEASVTLNDGHYFINLPFKNENTCLPNNICQANQRLKSLERKFKRNLKFFEDYKLFMANILEKGYAEPVPDSALKGEDGKIWYIPHHGVYHPRKPDKVRVVFDCSAVYQGVSLNNMLLQGPDLTNSLIGVLLRFRQENIALMGDIESMFYQVRVPESDSNFLRFLWWPNGDLSNSPKVYRMKVHLFGGVSSPSCSTAALQQTARDNTNTYPESVTKVLLKNFYVDDCLMSARTEREACKQVSDLMSLCKLGGFTLTKWVSNSRSVLQHIPQEHRAKEIKYIDLKFDAIPCERALGVVWNPQLDILGFKILLRNTQMTKRNILSIVSSVYDPLGFASPFILPAKISLQELCKLGVSWDGEIPERQAKIFEQWLIDLPLIENLQIPRCYKPYGFGDISSCQVHLFSDASNVGYGVVAYLRLTNKENKVHCSILMAKSRVAPLNTMTIPRMELTAATIAIRLSAIIQKELEYPVDKVFYWTDSMSVLRYIANESSRFHTFVANRVAVIRDASDIQQWNYVDTKTNPADEASRGLKMAQLLKAEHWLKGPEFLWQAEHEWPVSPILRDSDVQTDDPEVRKTFVTIQDVEPVDRLLNYCSSWMKLKRFVAWFLRLKDLLRAKVLGKVSNVTDHCPKGKFLTMKELERSELAIITHVQSQHFQDEISSLNGEVQKLKGSSPIKRLDPYLLKGLIRVGGRLNRAAVPESVKHPIVIPGDSVIAKLIIRDVHENVGHQGKNSILSRVRQRYWILKASSIIKSFISRCAVCRKYQAKVQNQKMADLPIDRLTPDEPPFTRSGLDYFGPFVLKRGRSNVKRYGVIFTCLATRAVHLEVAHSLTTDSCINALRRFVARRGTVQVIWSDNGTNLVGCKEELKTAIRSWNQSRINNDLLQKNIRWEFNPPAGSHHGGVWERMIRSVRKILYSLLKQQVIKLDDELFSTLFCEVESILNARPLTELPVNPNDFEPLTPNHLLLLQSNNQFPPGVFLKSDTYARRRWRQVQYLANVFWSRWLREYIPLLQTRQKWIHPNRNFQVGDVVLLADNTPRNTWSLGKISQPFPDRKGFVRIVQVKTNSGYLKRPVNKLCLIAEGCLSSSETPKN